MRKSLRTSQFLRTAAMVLVCASLVGACTSRVATRGNLPDEEMLAQLKPGEITRGEVAEFLGSPSTVATFDQETWLYISEQTETWAFMESEVMERKVVILQFDKEGVLSSIDTVGLDQARDIEPVERKTPTLGNEMTVLDQVLANMQRFVRKKK